MEGQSIGLSIIPPAKRPVAVLKAMNADSQLAVEIEDDSTWPTAFAELAHNNKRLVIDYQRERSRIEQLCQGDVSIKIDPPGNRYKSEYTAAAQALEILLLPHRLVAYHCTRLTPREAMDIKTNGLRLLSRELIAQKIKHGVADGYLSETDAEYLRQSQYTAETLSNRAGRRTGNLCYCPTRSTLKLSGHVNRFFRHWGGEALYWGHEEDAKISPALAVIGSPYILKCAIPIASSPTRHRPFSDRFLSQLVCSEVEHPEPPPGFDFVTRQDLEGPNVLELIEFANPKFAVLTEHHRWDAKYQPMGARVQAAT